MATYGRKLEAESLIPGAMCWPKAVSGVTVLHHHRITTEPLVFFFNFLKDVFFS